MTSEEIAEVFRKLIMESKEHPDNKTLPPPVILELAAAGIAAISALFEKAQEGGTSNSNNANS